MPAWALDPAAAGGTPTPVGPPGLGTSLVFWVKGDAGLVPSSDDLRMLTWANSATPSPNPGLISAGTDGANGPLVGIDSLDGIPGVTFPGVDPGAFFLVQLAATPGVPLIMKDRDGTNFGYGAGETQARTTISVCRAIFCPDIFDIVGGTLVRFGTTPTGGTQDFETLFNLEPLTAPDAFFLFSNDWRNSYALALQGPPTDGGADGPYTDVPVVVEHSSSGFDEIQTFVNGVEVTLTPAVMPAAVGGHPVQDWFVYGAVNQVGDLNGQWHGARFEDLIYDVKLTGAPRSQLYAYLAARFPTIPIVVP